VILVVGFSILITSLRCQPQDTGASGFCALNCKKKKKQLQHLNPSFFTQRNACITAKGIFSICCNVYFICKLLDYGSVDSTSSPSNCSATGWDRCLAEWLILCRQLYDDV